MTIILGIDPGASGGFAFIEFYPLQPDVAPVVQARKMPDTERDVWSLIREWASTLGHTFIEKVHSMPAQGVSSTFKFGQNYGMLRMGLIARGAPFETVTPQKWQKEFGLYKKGNETNVQKKNRHKARAQELFPAIKITHATADALLIMEYGRRMRMQELKKS